jgi:hypothetical protein
MWRRNSSRTGVPATFRGFKMKLRVDPLIVNSKIYGNTTDNSCYRCRLFERDSAVCKVTGSSMLENKSYAELFYESLNEGPCDDYLGPWKIIKKL